ncbi:MAG: hypothetical protein IKL68_06110 [Clostridia bacterium]|nr:hypothetical protein [Clostridia bacterium]
MKKSKGYILLETEDKKEKKVEYEIQQENEEIKIQFNYDNEDYEFEFKNLNELVEAWMHYGCENTFLKNVSDHLLELHKEEWCKRYELEERCKETKKSIKNVEKILKEEVEEIKKSIKIRLGGIYNDM